jgi:hypothetical protein
MFGTIHGHSAILFILVVLRFCKVNWGIQCLDFRSDVFSLTCQNPLENYRGIMNLSPVINHIGIYILSASFSFEF